MSEVYNYYFTPKEKKKQRRKKFYKSIEEHPILQIPGGTLGEHCICPKSSSHNEKTTIWTSNVLLAPQHTIIKLLLQAKKETLLEL